MDKQITTNAVAGALIDFASTPPGRHARPYRETSEWFAAWRSRGPFADHKPGRHRADAETEQVAS